MYASSCKFVDMRIDIVKYEEGFFHLLNRKCNSCSTSFEP